MAQSKQLTQHTPGPWEYDRHLFPLDAEGYEHETYSICASSGAPYVASVNKGQECSSDEARANARLIAAAPELLEATNNLLQELRGHFPTIAEPVETCSGLKAAYLIAKQAIAKAEQD